MQHAPINTHLKRQRAAKGIPLRRTFWSAFIDAAIYPIGTLSLLLTIPQVYDVWVLKQTEGVALITWSMWTVSSFFWLVYGVFHRAHAIVIMQVGWIVLNLLVIMGVLIFR